MKIDRRTFIASAAAAVMPMPAVAKYADPESAEQLYDYLLRHCICSEGKAAACHVVEEHGDWVAENGMPIHSIRFIRYPYHVRISMGAHEEGAILNMDGLCTDEAAATRMWLSNFRRDAGDATHIIWREKPRYEFIPERFVPFTATERGDDGKQWTVCGFRPDLDFVPGGLIYSRLWFGKL